MEEEEPTEEEVELMKKDNLMEEIVGNEDEGVEPVEESSEPKTTVFP